MNKYHIENLEELAEVLKTRRRELNITQKTLADFCNLSHNGISRIELAQSDAQLSTLLKMSKILGFKIILEMEQ
ncbi:helix-turn-helix domain-containing protein [Legionella quateirensis]|uniref:Helix-turn-helix protein n=1 Tax=Legionella quateirensis TaxID=45072 RepID=A0A378KVF0_9GAMM|nr:helix-turn-helix transcriptional regulator [Legionella quateirensis]KTD43280.1 helix-turn-helix protein [Legionella quateirensis]STY18159.1 transcriptional regulator, y4mF family [Legionella quateirensis]